MLSKNLKKKNVEKKTVTRPKSLKQFVMWSFCIFFWYSINIIWVLWEIWTTHFFCSYFFCGCYTTFVKKQVCIKGVHLILQLFPAYWSNFGNVHGSDGRFVSALERCDKPKCYANFQTQRMYFQCFANPEWASLVPTFTTKSAVNWL